MNLKMADCRWSRRIGRKGIWRTLSDDREKRVSLWGGPYEPDSSPRMRARAAAGGDGGKGFRVKGGREFFYKSLAAFEQEGSGNTREPFLIKTKGDDLRLG